jgi:hypothetical protein
MFVPDIVGRIQISVQTVATFTTEEKRLRTAILTSLMLAGRTPLRGVPRVNFDHSNPTSLSLVAQEAVELGKAPGMHTALSFAWLVRDTLANIGQVLKHQGTAWGSRLHNAFGKNMVVVSSLPKQFPTQLLEMPLSRASAFSLKLTTQMEDAAFLLFPPMLPEKVTSGRDRRVIESQVNADHLGRGSDQRRRQRDDNMEEVASLAHTQVSRTDVAADVLLGMLRNRERQFHATRNGSKTGREDFPLDPVGTLVVTDGSGLRLRTTNRLEGGRLFAAFPGCCNQFGIPCSMLLLPGESRFDGFGGFHTSRADQLRRQVRILLAESIVGFFGQVYAIAAFGCKSKKGNGIEARRVLSQRTSQEVSLLCGRIQLYDNGSIHAKGMSYLLRIVNRQGSFVSSPCLKALVSIKKF